MLHVRGDDLIRYLEYLTNEGRNVKLTRRCSGFGPMLGNDIKSKTNHEFVF